MADRDVYLHLSRQTYSISSHGGQLRVTGIPGKAELAVFRTHFQCQCYSGYRGEACAQKDRGQNRASSVFGTWTLCLLLPLGLLSLLHGGTWEVENTTSTLLTFKKKIPSVCDNNPDSLPTEISVVSRRLGFDWHLHCSDAVILRLMHRTWTDLPLWMCSMRKLPVYPVSLILLGVCMTGGGTMINYPQLHWSLQKKKVHIESSVYVPLWKDWV